MPRGDGAYLGGILMRLVPAVLVVLSGAAFAAPLTPAERDAKRAWVEEVRNQDFFYWERYFDRLEKIPEFQEPPYWYRPSELVEGGAGAPLPVAAAAERTVPDAAFKAAADYAFSHNSTYLAVLRDGRVEHVKYGDGKHPGSMYAVHSFTKFLPPLLVGFAIADGKIPSIDTRIGDLVKEWAADPRGAITLRHLLANAGGLENPPQTAGDPDNKLLRLAEGSNVNAVALSYAATSPPGTKFQFSNADSQLLGLAVERATGRRFADYLSEKLWRPMGAATATLNLDGKYGDARAFCCMRSLASDWLRIGRLVVDGGGILPPGWVAEMSKPSVANPFFGHGLWRGLRADQTRPPPEARLLVNTSKPYSADDVLFIQGGGYVTLWMVPSLKLVVLRLGEMHKDWDAPVIPNIIIDALKR